MLVGNGQGMKNDRVLQESEIHMLFQLWTHVSAQAKHKKYKSLVREAVLRNSGVCACALQQAEMGQAVAAGDIQEVWRRVMHLSYANLRYEKECTLPMKGTVKNIHYSL